MTGKCTPVYEKKVGEALLIPHEGCSKPDLLYHQQGLSISGENGGYEASSHAVIGPFLPNR